MKEHWTIRQGIPADGRVIAEFNIAMARETEDRALNPDTILAGVLGLMKRPELGFYIVGGNDTGIFGSLMITSEWTDWRNGLFWWIQSVYVTPEKRRKGLYREMYDHIVQEAHKHPDIRGLRLYVDKNNRTARRTYSLLGMSETDYRLYEIGFNER